MPTPDYTRRIEAAGAAGAAAGADGLLITNLANVLYLSGFTGTAGRLLVARGRLYFMTDFRYSRSVEPLVAAWPSGSQVIEITGSYDDGLAGVVRAAGVGRLAIEPGHVTVSQWRAWSARLDDVELVVPADEIGIIERLRLIKEEGELEILREAGARISGIARSLREWVRVGRSERETAADINHAMARAGFAKPAFETIVASGPHAAMPHARPTDRRVAKGDLVVVDFGGMLDGYAVDITRTLSAGPADAGARALHAAVLEAQAAAAAALAPGRTVQEIDNAARAVLDTRGFGGAVRHAVGHGLGLDVHEAPRLSRDAPATAPRLAAGMVVTIEPGAYLDARGVATGVRIEDDLIVRAGGPEWLTDAPRDLIETD